ncbi:acyltransferase ChoActase/COT/CPT [Neoconidiobolus thromboides FSU 785]|nr:acyltransferase ChoActase/COT/CPT [Neoconidiobolus thromboides FSU 785]
MQLIRRLKSKPLQFRQLLSLQQYSVKTDSGIEKSKLKTFDNQTSLPRLPIPPLEHTLKMYEKSLLPLYDEIQYKDALKAIAPFYGEEGNKLQQRLIEYDLKQKNSWLEDIWLNKGYLEYREPTLLNVNWWCEFKDHPNGLVNNPIKGKTTDLQIERAAGLITGILNFNDALNREEIEPEYIKETPLCMNQYHQQLGTTRIPKMKRDKIESSYPCLAHHIILSYKNQLVEVPVYGKNSERVSIKTIINQLRLAINSIDNLDQSQYQPNVGILTGEHRDIWAKARELLETNQLNQQTLNYIDTSLFVLCLEDYSPSTNIDESHQVIFHGHTGQNRWFDKAIQLILTNNGRAGINGEHTPADAVIPGRIINEILANEPHSDPINVANDITLEEPKLLRWEVNNEVNTLINEAHERVPKFISNIESVLLHHSGIGSALLKSLKVSPDTFLQMALQLAYYRQQGEVGPTYETASTRAFLHGRTETVRSCSIESKQFVQLFDDKDISHNKKLEAIKNAFTAHLSYMKKASRGQGIDRHLLGLRCMIQEEEKTPQLFQHPSYIESMSFKLSTSNMSPGKYFYGGFAPVVKDGYGVNYAIDKQDIKLSISKWNQSNSTDHLGFRKNIQKAIEDLAGFLAKQ